MHTLQWYSAAANNDSSDPQARSNQTSQFVLAFSHIYFGFEYNICGYLKIGYGLSSVRDYYIIYVHKQAYIVL